MSAANTLPDGLPEESVVMRLTEGAVPRNPDRYADHASNMPAGCQHVFGVSNWVQLGEGWAVVEVCTRCDHRVYSHHVGQICGQ